jgi:hypothetical protein
MQWKLSDGDNQTQVAYWQNMVNQSVESLGFDWFILFHGVGKLPRLRVVSRDGQIVMLQRDSRDEICAADPHFEARVFERARMLDILADHCGEANRDTIEAIRAQLLAEPKEVLQARDAEGV